jgi:hypothetical protein
MNGFISPAPLRADEHTRDGWRVWPILDGAAVVGWRWLARADASSTRAVGTMGRALTKREAVAAAVAAWNTLHARRRGAKRGER